MKRKFSGAYGIVLTPFKNDGSCDFKTLELHLEKAFSSPLDGIVMCGSTGEFSRMSFEENSDVIRLAANLNHGRKQLICGATAPDSHHANKYMELISSLGASGALVAPPYYFSLGDEEIIAFYKDIAKNNRGGADIIGYNIPQCTNAVSVNVFKELLEIENFKGFKNSWHNLCDIMDMINLRNSLRPDVSMLTGLDSCLYATLALGGDGLFTAISYLLPGYARTIIDNFGKSSEAFDCQCDMLELINSVNKFSFPYGYRVLAEAAGFPLGKSRQAVPESIQHLASSELPKMKEIINKLNRRYSK